MVCKKPLFFEDTHFSAKSAKTTLETSEEDGDPSLRYFGFINEENYEKMIMERNKKKNQFEFNERNQGFHLLHSFRV